MSCRQIATGTAAAGEKIITGLLTLACEVNVDRLSGLLGDLELNWPAGLSLPNRGPVDRVAVWRNILDLEADDIASSELAVHGEVEKRQITYPTL